MKRMIDGWWIHKQWVEKILKQMIDFVMQIWNSISNNSRRRRGRRIATLLLMLLLLWGYFLQLWWMVATASGFEMWCEIGVSNFSTCNVILRGGSRPMAMAMAVEGQNARHKRNTYLQQKVNETLLLPHKSAPPPLLLPTHDAKVRERDMHTCMPHLLYQTHPPTHSPLFSFLWIHWR